MTESHVPLRATTWQLHIYSAKLDFDDTNSGRLDEYLDSGHEKKKNGKLARFFPRQLCLALCLSENRVSFR